MPGIIECEGIKRITTKQREDIQSRYPNITQDREIYTIYFQENYATMPKTNYETYYQILEHELTIEEKNELSRNIETYKAQIHEKLESMIVTAKEVNRLTHKIQRCDGMLHSNSDILKTPSGVKILFESDSDEMRLLKVY